MGGPWRGATALPVREEAALVARCEMPTASNRAHIVGAWAPWPRASRVGGGADPGGADPGGADPSWRLLCVESVRDVDVGGWTR